MKNKILPIIIIVIILTAIIFVVYSFFLNGKKVNNNVSNNKEQISIEKPNLELKLNTEKENQESVVISAYATTKDSEGIKSITLPDGTEIKAEETTYKVSENGTYSFKATGVNGETVSLSINVKNIKVQSSDKPYIPDGFKHVEGEIDTGFTIEDDYGNQYVWIPVKSGEVIRNTNENKDYEEIDETALGLVNSVAKNYGFYIGKFESSKYDLDGEEVSASMEGKIPWTNITYLDAAKIANEAASKYKYKDCNTAILNSYAWDTALDWLNSNQSNYSTNTNFGNYSGTIYPTGQTEKDIIGNLCDIAGNVREWTTEVYKAEVTTIKENNEEKTIFYRVVRGGSANLSRTPASHIGYPENTSDSYWGFRMILYK